jgi:hypothetical protein
MSVGYDETIGVPDGTGPTPPATAAHLYQAAPGTVYQLAQFLVKFF